MKRRLWFALVLLLSAILMTACQVSASEEGITLEGFLIWLMSPAAIGITLSVILEKAPFAKKYFDKITDPDIKRLVVLIFCLATPMLALIVGSLTLGWGLTADAVFKALAVGWDAFATATVMHSIIRER